MRRRSKRLQIGVAQDLRVLLVASRRLQQDGTSCTYALLTGFADTLERFAVKPGFQSDVGRLERLAAA
jgi:hypothetical protein